MLSSEDKTANKEAIAKQELSAIELHWEQLPQRERIFEIIENILSFEACLYHQILPLGLQDNKLLLGMVNPKDDAALEYVNQILPYLNYIMEAQEIAGETHRSFLSTYLNYKNTSGLVAEQENKSISHGCFDQESREANEQPTLILHEIPKHSPLEHTITDNEQPFKTTSFGVANTPLANLPVLSVPSKEQLTQVELLVTLPPKKMLQELLGRVLAGGIGRLYLERGPYEGRILWSENGILQSVLEKLPLSVFQGVLNELKRFGSLPTITVTEAKQVEKECLYQQDRLLLRLRIMPGMYGEEGTLQVLRGAALKFYQQQQLTRVSRDAVGISKQLSYKLHELQQRLLFNGSANAVQLQALAALNELVDNLDRQIKILVQSSEIRKKD